MPFHRRIFSSKRLFIEAAVHQMACSSSITLDVEVLQKFCLQFWKFDEIVHLMNKPFDEKPLRWKGALMKRHSTLTNWAHELKYDIRITFIIMNNLKNVFFTIKDNFKLYLFLLIYIKNNQTNFVLKNSDMVPRNCYCDALNWNKLGFGHIFKKVSFFS